MRFKIHPHQTLFKAGSESCVSITPIKKHGRAYYMGSVILSDVEFTVHPSGLKQMLKDGSNNVHPWIITGEILSESPEQYRPEVVDTTAMAEVRYDLSLGRFFSGDVDVTDGHYRAAVVVGNQCFISREW